MTCDPQAYFQASKSIQAVAQDEAGYRAVVSRAYYATYHCCREYYAALPYLGAVMGNGMHEQLINALRFPSKNLTSNGKARSEALGKYLRDMCNARVHADYHPEAPLSQKQMQEAMGTAEMIFEVSASTKGAVSAPPTLASQG